METAKFVYYQEGDFWVGWLDEYPDYATQGRTLDELKENLKEIHGDRSEGPAASCAERLFWFRQAAGRIDGPVLPDEALNRERIYEERR